MHQIQITEFSNYNTISFFEYLQVQNETVYTVLLPRLLAAEDPSDFNHFWDYKLAAYAGQKLRDVAQYFGYTIPCPATKDPFSFQLTVTNQYHFAELLKKLAEIYNKKDDNNTLEEFHIQAMEFFIQSFESEDDFSPTFGLLIVANEHLQKFENSR